MWQLTKPSKQSSLVTQVTDPTAARAGLSGNPSVLAVARTVQSCSPQAGAGGGISNNNKQVLEQGNPVFLDRIRWVCISLYNQLIQIIHIYVLHGCNYVTFKVSSILIFFQGVWFCGSGTKLISLILTIQGCWEDWVWDTVVLSPGHNDHATHDSYQRPKLTMQLPLSRKNKTCITIRKRSLTLTQDPH